MFLYWFWHSPLFWSSVNLRGTQQPINFFTCSSSWIILHITPDPVLCSFCITWYIQQLSSIDIFLFGQHIFGNTAENSLPVYFSFKTEFRPLLNSLNHSNTMAWDGDLISCNNCKRWIYIYMYIYCDLTTF